MRASLIVAIGMAAGFSSLGAVPATSQTPQAEPADTETDATNAGNEIICRRVAPPTGSRIGPRNVCKTRHEWDQITAESRDVVENIGNRSRIGGN